MMWTQPALDGFSTATVYTWVLGLADAGLRCYTSRSQEIDTFASNDDILQWRITFEAACIR